MDREPIPLLKGRKHDVAGAVSFVLAPDAMAPYAWACPTCGKPWRHIEHARACCPKESE